MKACGLKDARTFPNTKKGRSSNMSIGQRISNLRKENGYSQEYVAERLDVSRQAVSKWETDTSAPDTYNLIALAELFGVSVEYIATGKREEPPKTKPTEAAKPSVPPCQRTAGYILLGGGLLALILGILLSELLVLLSVYLLIGGVLCIAVRRRLFLVATWTFLAVTFLTVTVLTTQNLFSVFDPSAYGNGIHMGMIVSYAFWIWLIAATVFTVIDAVRKHRGR